MKYARCLIKQELEMGSIHNTVHQIHHILSKPDEVRGRSVEITLYLYVARYCNRSDRVFVCVKPFHFSMRENYSKYKTELNHFRTNHRD